MDEDAQKDFTYRMTEMSTFETKKNWWISLNTSGRNAPVKLRPGTVFTKSLEKSDLHRFLSGSIRNGIRRLLHPAHHGGSGTIPGGAHKIHQSQAPLSS